MCKLYHQAESLHTQGVHVVSTDEKTGIQATERIYPTRPMKSGKPEAVEFEYERHGTQALIATSEVATGKVICSSVGPTRTEEDFAAHIRATVEIDPQGQWIFICDQLNTHKSESLVNGTLRKNRRKMASNPFTEPQWGRAGLAQPRRAGLLPMNFLRRKTHTP